MSKCGKRISDAFGKIDIKEAEKIAQDARIRMTATTGKLGPQTVASQTAEMLAQAEIDKANRKRMAAMNLEKKAAMFNQADAMIARGIPYKDVVLAMVEGMNTFRYGSEFSLDSKVKSSRGKWHSSLMDKLDISNRPDLEKVFKSGKDDLEILQAIENIALGLDNKGKKSTSVEVAQVLSDLMEKMRVEMVDSGAYIEKRFDWMLCQSHDSSRIRKA